MARLRVIISSHATTAPRDRSKRAACRHACANTSWTTSSASSGSARMRSASEYVTRAVAVVERGQRLAVALGHAAHDLQVGGVARILLRRHPHDRPQEPHHACGLMQYLRIRPACRMAAATAARGEAGRIGAQKRPGRAVVYTRPSAADRRRYDGTLPMRWLVLTLAAVLAVPAAARRAAGLGARPTRTAWKPSRRGQRRARRAEADRGPRSPAGAEAVAPGQLLVGRLPAVHPRLLPRRDRRAATAATPRRRSCSKARSPTSWSPRATRPSSSSRRPACSGPATSRRGWRRTSGRTAQPGARQAAAGHHQHEPAPGNPSSRTPGNPATPPSTSTGTTVTPPPERPPPPTNAEPAWLAGFRRAMNASRAVAAAGPLLGGAQQASPPRRQSPATRRAGDGSGRARARD